MSFEKHRLQISCSENGMSSTELEIHGIGTIGFRSHRPFKTRTQVELFLPSFKMFELRDSLFNLEKQTKRNKIK